jgi:hypothetical protein
MVSLPIRWCANTDQSLILLFATLHCIGGKIRIGVRIGESGTKEGELWRGQCMRGTANKEEGVLWEVDAMMTIDPVRGNSNTIRDTIHVSITTKDQGQEVPILQFSW